MTVSKSSDVNKLQNATAHKLELKFSEEEDEITRIGKSCEALRGKKRCMLILDDLWEVSVLSSGCGSS